jgi:hypothetical protein
MNRRFFATAILLACSLALCASVAPPRAAAQAFTETDNQTVPIDFIATACNGETVIISGDSHVVVHLTSNPNHTTFKTHIQFQLSGTSASGIKFNANETVDSIENTSTGAAQVLNSVGQLHLISQGSTDNLVVRTTIHVTINANGEITATSFEFTTECNG